MSITATHNEDSSSKSRRVFLTLPAFNEAENLTPLIEHAYAVFGQHGLDGTVIVVDDGSSDNTLEVLRGLQETYPLQVEIHPQNRGLGGAIMTGLKAAAGLSKSSDDIIVGMDADNTHSPEYIPLMAEKIWNGGKDIVIASRFQPGSQEIGVPPFRLFLSRGARYVFRAILRLPGVRDYTCGFRAYRAGLIQGALERYGDGLIRRSGFACTDELLVRLSNLTKRIAEIPFVLRYDQKRSRSKLPLFRTIVETFRLLFEAKE